MSATSGEKRYLPGIEAAGDLSAKQYHIMRLSDAKVCNQASNAGDAALAGVLDNKPDTANQAAAIVRTGMTPVTLGASLGVNARFTTNGSGRAAAVTSGQYVIGITLEAGTADGDIVTSWIHDPYYFGG